MRRKYNSLKQKVLRILSGEQKWFSVPVLAAKLDLGYPERSLYSYLRHLAGIDLGAPGKDSRGRLYYRATDRGLARLKFLERKEVR